MKDLSNLFEYNEPSDDNLNTYSHRTYELFLRICTEYEANSKAILTANGYNVLRRLNITDYAKINNSSKLSEYSVIFFNWRNNPKEFYPFRDFTNGNSLSWYSDYNQVKHDRHINFNLASFSNVMLSVSGLISILYSQFHMYIFKHYIPESIWSEEYQNYKYAPGSIFGIKSPVWSEDERYRFQWDDIQNDPFQRYQFQEG